MGKGTTLDDPVTAEQVPDLKGARHEIDEYLNEQGVYDIFDFLLKELMTKQPAKPLQHMKRCLQVEHPTGPLKVVVSSPPGLGRPALAKSLAETLGLVYISAGELLADAGVETAGIGYAEEEQVARLVLGRLREATAQLQGWVLDGFPRTRLQTSHLKEQCMVPAHILQLKASEEQIRERNRLVGEGELEGTYVEPEALEQKLRLHTCHDSAAFEVYEDRISVIDAQLGGEHVLAEMVRRARTLPRSRGPQPPPRVVLLGPRGAGLHEHASRLAARLGAVLVDAQELQRLAPHAGGAKLPSAEKPSSRRGHASQGTPRTPLGKGRTSMDLPNQDSLAAVDRLGAVGLRLRQDDCTKQGWVLCGFPASAAAAKCLQQDAQLCPRRVAALTLSQEACVHRLRHLLHDPVTGKVWTSMPRSELIRKRLLRDPNDQPAAVIAAHSAFNSALPSIMQALGADACCVEISAEGPPQEVFGELVEFVERPLPLRTSA